eukprot:1161225-Pelagomonas_calceolata.AAC.2
MEGKDPVVSETQNLSHPPSRKSSTRGAKADQNLQFWTISFLFWDMPFWVISWQEGDLGSSHFHHFLNKNNGCLLLVKAVDLVASLVGRRINIRKSVSSNKGQLTPSGKKYKSMLRSNQGASRTDYFVGVMCGYVVMFEI